MGDDGVMRAAGVGHEAIVRLLLEMGAVTVRAVWSGLSHGPAKYSEETVDSKLKREEERRGRSSPSAAINTGGAWCVRTEAKGGYL